AALDGMIEAIRMVPTHWIWSQFTDAVALREYRQRTFETFVGDLAAVKSAGRYIAAALPHLPFQERSFDIALCSHLLFSWSGVLGWRFHLEAITEMLSGRGGQNLSPSKNLATVR